MLAPSQQKDQKIKQIQKTERKAFGPGVSPSAVFIHCAPMDRHRDVFSVLASVQSNVASNGLETSADSHDEHVQPRSFDLGHFFGSLEEAKAAANALVERELARWSDSMRQKSAAATTALPDQTRVMTHTRGAWLTRADKSGVLESSSTASCQCREEKDKKLSGTESVVCTVQIQTHDIVAATKATQSELQMCHHRLEQLRALEHGVVAVDMRKRSRTIAAHPQDAGHHVAPASMQVRALECCRAAVTIMCGSMQGSEIALVDNDLSLDLLGPVCSWPHPAPLACWPYLGVSSVCACIRMSVSVCATWTVGFGQLCV
jgi:hypothetical protein